LNGEALPRLLSEIPGPQSRRLAARLQRVESRNITAVDPEPPIFWEAAVGANVQDVDGNIYIDLTSGFGVANAGHSNPAVAAALSQQAHTLAHALGDVYPAEIKVRLLEKLSSIMPGDLSVAILANSGAEAVEAALKTAVMKTGRTGILAFKNAYHGLTYGALATTHRAHFRAPFEQQLFNGVRFASFGDLAEVDALISSAENSTHPIGCIVVEPVQGRGGVILPPDDFLPALRERCDGANIILVFDEIYVGMGRCGKWLACEHWQTTPDIAVIGKGLSGALPLSAAVGTPDVMNAWPASSGEAIHTSTFIGNPIACAAALAQIAEIEARNLIDRALALGVRIRTRTDRWRDKFASVADTRGVGLIQAVELHDARAAHVVVRETLKHGVLLLMEGANANILSITPPAVITDAQLDHALDVVEHCLTRTH
jgi:4-aminobutyrate aminotransferase-like enzyme